MWQNGEIPSNFDENHSDYDKAVQYTIHHNGFDYEEFCKGQSIIEFGAWRVESDALVGKVGYDYIIECHRFWETEEYNGHLLWSWLIHLAKKAWITNENINDLNTAFFFCQDYFKANKPANHPEASTAQTLNIQKQLLAIREEMDKTERAGINGIIEMDIESMLKYRDLINGIQYL